MSVDIATTVRVAYLRKELAHAHDEIERLRALITTWADAEDLLEYDVDDPWSDLRRAVGR